MTVATGTIPIAITQRSVVLQLSKPWIGSYQNQYSTNSRQMVDSPPSRVMFGMPKVEPFHGDACQRSRRRYGNTVAAIEHRMNDPIQAKIPFRVLMVWFAYRYRHTSEAIQTTAI